MRMKMNDKAERKKGEGMDFFVRWAEQAVTFLMAAFLPWTTLRK